MPSLSNIILACAAIGFSAAAPAPIPYTECPSGYQWYTCAKNDFAGCCSVDPCDLDACPDIPPTSTSPIPSATPIPSPPTQSCADDGRIRDYGATLWTVWRDEPQRSVGTSSIFNISQSDNRVNKVNQVITFGVHPKAISCRIGWFQPAHAPGFDVVNTGVTPVYQLDLGGLPWDQAVSPNGASVNWENVQPLLSEKKVGVADFTFWDEMDVEDVHSVGDIECNQSSLAFLADLDGTTVSMEALRCYKAL